MKARKKVALIFTLLFYSIGIYPQNIPIGQWRAHLPFVKGQSVTDAGSKIFCAAEDALFSYNKEDNSLTSYSKINGLSDIGISVIRYYSRYNVLLIGYQNANIDLMYGNEIINISDIKRKNIVGSKSINDITFIDRYAYLSCGFGIVVIDLQRREIKDTYYIGPSGGTMNVSGVAFDGSSLYVASDSGVYRININDPDINFYAAWTNILPNENGKQYNQIVYFSNKIFISVHVTANNFDYLKVYDGGNWIDPSIGLYGILKLQAANNKLTLTGMFDVNVYDTNLQPVISVNQSTYSCSPRDAASDNAGILWIADNNKGLVKTNSSLQIEYIAPDGPHSKFSAGMEIVNDKLWVGHSTTGRKWLSTYSFDGFSTFADNKWTTYDKTNLHSPIVSMDSLFDFVAIAIDDRNSNHVFLGTHGAGLLEMENGAIKNYFNESNSTLQSAIGNPSSCETGGIAFDKNYNLWVTNSSVADPLSELKADGTWQSFSFPGALAGNPSIGEFLIDSYGQKWIDVNENGFLVFDETGTLGTVKYKYLTLDSTGLPSNDIRAMVEDKEGQVWFGTSKGVAVFYSPGSMLSYPTPRAQQVLLLQDNTYQYLLATEVVTSIGVDGANRKWFGTENSGVFLMSADGTKQILHFTAENSSLLSNNILCLAINQKTGEVFFGTDRGIISYKSDAVEGDDKCHDTYVYPNPVYHEYSGPIAIKGLVNNGNVKITDISGTLVYETTALGGQAIWNGRNFNGEKSHTGVYLVFCSDEEGKNTCITKLLFFN